MQTLQSIISSHIASLYGDIVFSPTLSAPPKPEHGEYCFGVFTLAKPLGKSPNMIAEEIANMLREDTTHFTQVNVIGGYVNLSCTAKVWMDILSQVENTQQGKKNETIVVDYIGMNVGKPPHIGHICTPLQGQSIINVLKYKGYNVISDSHLGDWGLLFGKLIIGFQKYGSREKLAEDAINHLLEIYIAINTDTETDPSIEQICRDAFRELSSGKPEYTDLWAEFTTASIATNKKMLELMHIHQDYDIGESFYEGLPIPKIGTQPDLVYDMNSIVTELIEKGIATQNEDGSVGVVFAEETKIPSTILRKKDGTNLYLTSDLAAIKYRITNGWNPSRILYFVDVRQSLHLKQAFTIAKMAWGNSQKQEIRGSEDISKGAYIGVSDREKSDTDKEVRSFSEFPEITHAANGAIVLPEGAMSTRKGNIIRLDALVDEGYIRVKALLEEKERNLSEDDIREIAIGAIKYSYLSQDRERDVVFTWDKALSFEGNSGPYIQYACVRAKKVYDQSASDCETVKLGNCETVILSPYDTALIRTLAEMEAKIQATADTYKPHTLALYCYDLAVCFNSFYVHTPKILEETDFDLRNLRLHLCRLTHEKLTLGFDLLAIRMPSEM